MTGLQLAGYQEASLLEIGCGVGHLHQTLLEAGAGTSTGIELAPQMLELARRWADERGLTQRSHYVEGDFMTLTEQIDTADVTLLDKVICCYPDAHGLVHQSLAKTKRVYAFTIPRNTWYMRIGVKLGAALMWTIRSDFRPYLHDPSEVERWIETLGFRKLYENTTNVWLSRVYTRT
jgi:magnesium-protoporphyrin O-methyltransferase